MPADLPFAALLLDFDGTLVDSEVNWMRAENRLLTEYGVEWNEQRSMEFVGMALNDVGRAMLAITGATDTNAEGIRDRLIAYAIEDMSEVGVPWQPGAEDLLTEVRERGVPTALVTGSYMEVVKPFLEKLPAGTLDAVVTGDQTERGKPHPDPYLEAASRLGVDAAACLAVEDSNTGIGAAQAAGCLVIGVPYLVELDDRPGLVKIPSLAGVTVADLAGIVREHRA